MGREDLAARVTHLSYGRVKGLSTRRGRTEAVEEIVESGREKAIEWMRGSPTRRELTEGTVEEGGRERVTVGFQKRKTLYREHSLCLP